MKSHLYLYLILNISWLICVRLIILFSCATWVQKWTVGLVRLVGLSRNASLLIHFRLFLVFLSAAMSFTFRIFLFRSLHVLSYSFCEIWFLSVSMFVLDGYHLPFIVLFFLLVFLLLPSQVWLIYDCFNSYVTYMFVFILRNNWRLSAMRSIKYFWNNKTHYIR